MGKNFVDYKSLLVISAVDQFMMDSIFLFLAFSRILVRQFFEGLGTFGIHFRCPYLIQVVYDSGQLGKADFRTHADGQLCYV